VLYVLLPLVAQAFGLNYAQVGLIRTANRAALSILQLPAGMLAERYGERHLLVAGTACAGIGFLALGYASGFVAILASLFLAGCGSAFQHPLSSALISHAYPDTGRRAALGIYNFAGDVGKVGIAGLFGAMIAAGSGWQAPVMTLGTITVIGAALLSILLARVNGGSHAIHRTQHAAQPPRTGWGLRNPSGFAALCSIEIIDAMTRTGFLTFVAFLMLAKGVPEGWAVLSVPLVAAGGMLGKLCCGFLAERFGAVRTIAITEVASALGILMVVALPGISAYLVLPLVGIALNGTSSALYGSVGDLVEPERVSRAFGLFYTLGSASGVLAPVAYGILADKVGVGVAMLTAAALVTLTLPLCLWLSTALGQARARA
jgi:FSR family fosmidomycin resistance protein-like MFS transporter